MKVKNFNFDDLIVFDLANNHQGSVDHGLAVIRGVGEVAERHGVRAAMKFQFRQLDTFIHPVHHKGSDNKHIPRFLETRLTEGQYKTLFDEVRRQGMSTMCTPFDEESVDVIESMGFDIIKVASCSAKDWPLLERVAVAGLPVVFSTGGVEVADIDNLVSFFEHRGVLFAIMHCVAIYPTPDENCQLNQIDLLRARYPNFTIGWSTHEPPQDTAQVMVAAAKGARMFERHVGLEAEGIKLNAYSSTPQQVDCWLAALKKAKTICGVTGHKPTPATERSSLASLARGVYARRAVKAGAAITRDDVFFAMPRLEGQVESGAWKRGIKATGAVKNGEPLMEAGIEFPPPPAFQVLKTAVHEVKALLNEARIALNCEFSVEYSHHYGVRNFRETGAVLVDCVNREYCKKLIIQLPGQIHPSHYHDRKEETFQVLHGILKMEIDGHYRELHPGDTVLVLPGVWHSFWTEGGAVVEEISTTHYKSDSVYADPEINKMAAHQRKTKVDHWGRFQISNSGDGDK